MKDTKAALILTFIAAIVLWAALCDSHAQHRFGPFCHYAPYYFPKDGCKGFCFSAEDYRPTYEDPNPLPPPRGRMPAPKRRPSKVRPHVASAPMMPAMQAPPPHIYAQQPRPPLPRAHRISPRRAIQTVQHTGPRPVITAPVGPAQQ